jgi:hypothetical protein
MQGGVLLVNGSHDNTIHDDQIAANTGIGLGSGGNGFFFNPCTNSGQPFSPIEASMGRTTPSRTFVTAATTSGCR